MWKRLRAEPAGFTLTELVMVIAVFIIIAAIALPLSIQVTGRMRLGNALREVERELQTTRLKAVQSNRSLQVRFNCPAAGQYRVVEVMGTAIDNTANRCDETTYPYRGARDDVPATPDYDGPVRYVSGGTQFLGTGLTVLQFAPNGSTTQVTGATPVAIDVTGLNITLVKASLSGTINVNSLGRITIQ